MIAESDKLPRLRSLDLSSNKLQDAGFISLIKTKNYPQLEDLRLDTN